MNSYRLPDFKDKAAEGRYQQVVAAALLQAPADGPILVKPRAKYRGWSWTVYQRGGKEKVESV